MGVYVDIDMDYLVKPVIKESMNNVRIFTNNGLYVDNVESFVNKLANKGLLCSNDKKFFTNHRKSYTYWWIRKRQNMTVVHIDAHSDLYRNRNRDLRSLSDVDMACDDYMWYAIRDGFISKIYWVVPDGLYDLKDINNAKRFISESMMENCSCDEGKIEIIFNVITRFGEKKIDYTICTMENLPGFKDIELITVATSPEFIPKAADEDIFRGLRFLGAGNDEINRIKNMHMEMPEKSHDNSRALYSHNSPGSEEESVS